MTTYMIERALDLVLEILDYNPGTYSDLDARFTGVFVKSLRCHSYNMSTFDVNILTS